MKRQLVAGMSLMGLVIGATAVLWTTHAEKADAHCQVPCGIYDDSARITRLLEDTATIDKAVKQIYELSGKSDPQALNQATRWIITKEEHASHIIEVVAQYFLTQKVKPVAAGAEGYDAYLKTLADHHAVMSAAMKAKQTVDPSVVETLLHAVQQLGTHYKK